MTGVNNPYKCVCCHDVEFEHLYTSPEGEVIKKCRACGLIFTDIDCPEDMVVDCYGEEYYKQWHKESVRRQGMWRKRLRQLNKFCQPASLLDVGCGLGCFVKTARDSGWDVAATEVSEYAVNHISRKHNIDVMQGEINSIDFKGRKFDVVTMWHVLEHLDDPLKALEVVHSLLKDDGLLVIEVPNVYYLVQMVKSYLKTKNAFSLFTLKNNPEPHYFHFSVLSLKRLLRNAGFRVTNIFVGVYGEHQNGFFRRLKSRIYNVITVLVYLLSKKNIGVNTRIYAVKKKKPLSLAMVSLIVRRDLDKPLGNFQQIDIKHYYRMMPYDDMTSDELTETRLVKYRNGLDLFVKILKQRPDLIQGIDYILPAGLGEYLAILGLNLLCGIPFFFPVLENRPIEKKFNRVLAFPLKLCLRFYAARALFVIPLNRGAENNLVSTNVSKDKFKKILWGCWGVDLEEFSPRIKPVLLADDNQRMILFAGRLHYSKGISYLLEAFDKLRKEYHLKLVIIGDGEEKENILEFCDQRGLTGNVILKGSVKNEQMPGYFRAACITVTPSITTKRWEEQVGMTNIQSLACGVPVVSTYSGAIPEFIKDKEVGLLVKEKDADQLYKAIKELLENKKLYNQMSLAARQYCLERFDILKNIRIAEKLLLDSNRSL